MIAIIRIKGQVNVSPDIKETLSRLRLRKKYTCVVVKETPEMIGMVKKIRNAVAYGKIDEKVLVELIKKRGQKIDKKKEVKAEEVAKEILEGKSDKKLQDYNIKPFFRLHPPRGGIKTKLYYPKGVLGENKEISKLIKRML